MYDDQGTEGTEDSMDETLKELPSFLEPYEAGSEVIYLSSQTRNHTPVLDTPTLQNLLSTPIKCTLTIAELLKVRPQVWDDIGLCLEKMGIKGPRKMLEKEIKQIEK